MLSNKQIAQLLPKIMGSPIAYNQINGRFEFAVDLENFKRRSSSRSSSTVTSPLNSPTHEERPRTPLEQTGARFLNLEETEIVVLMIHLHNLRILVLQVVVQVLA